MVPLIAIHVTRVLLCCAVAVKLRTDCFLPPGRSESLLVVIPTFGVVDQIKVTPLSGVAQVNSTIMPSLTFLDSGIADSIMSASVPVIGG